MKKKLSQPIKQFFQKNKRYKGIVLIDRDGTIIRYKKYLRKKEDIEILPGVFSAIKLLNKNKIAAIIVTNQPAVALGIISLKEMKEINQELVFMLNSKSVYIDAVYTCPHHPDGTIKSFSMSCMCRKPGTLIFSEIIKDYSSKSVIGVIGDSYRDIAFGKNLGIRTIAVTTGEKESLTELIPDEVVDSFLTGTKKLLNIK